MRLAGRIALVTGASRGLGRAVARAFAQEGAHVIATARTTGGLEELDDDIQALGGKATLLRLDLAKGDEIDRLGPSLFERWGRLDILVCNAAQIGPRTPLAHVTTEAWAQILAVNLTANWRLLRTLDPLLQRSPAGRVIAVTAAEAPDGRAYLGPYAVSKAGLEALVLTYATEVANTAIRVNLVDPGRLRTRLRAAVFPGEPPETLPTPGDLAPLFVPLAAPDCVSHGARILLAQTPGGPSQVGPPLEGMK